MATGDYGAASATSLSTRRAWIEMLTQYKNVVFDDVALHTESVD